MSKFLLLLKIILLFTTSQIDAPDPDVLKLTDANFAKQMTVNENILVMFFIPWSTLCRRFRVNYARAATILKSNNLPVVLAKMDCSEKGRRICQSKNLGLHFPVFHFYHKGKFVKEYTGSRDTHSVIKFMRVQVLPAVIELKDVFEFNDFLKKQDDVVVVGFFEEESRLKKVFFRLAEEMKEVIIFTWTKCEKLLRKHKLFDGIALFRPENFLNRYEEEVVYFPGRVVFGEIKNFIIHNYYGLVGHRTPENLHYFPNPVIILYYTLDYDSSGRELTYWKSRILKTAHKYKQFVKFAISPKDEFEEELAEFTVDYTRAGIMKPFVLGKDLENKKFVMHENFSTETFDQFVDAFVNRQITPFLKSKSKPVHFETDGFVLIAKSKNFDQVVFENRKDVLLHLYGKWSGRVKRFSPILREVADLLQNEDVAIVKMDLTTNAVPKLFEGKDLPNVYFLRMGQKEKPILYSGGRTVEDVIRFIARHSTNPLKQFDKRGLPIFRNRDEL